MKHIQRIIIAIFIVTGFTSCDKITRDLGKETSSGENTMGFYVDGEAVKIKGKYERGGIFGEAKGLQANIVNGKTIRVYGVSEKNNCSIKISVPLDSISNLGEYDLYHTDALRDEAYFFEDASMGGKIYYTTSEYRGKIKFSRYDNKVISGTFHFDAINTETDKVISVTNGRFDISRQ